MIKPVTFFILCGMLIFASCIEKPVYPSTPVIAYKDFIRYGNYSTPDSVELVVSFTDNEGDVGLAQSDTQGIFKAGNIYMDYYYWDTTGIDHWAVFDTDKSTPEIDTLKFGYRVPPVLQTGDESEPMKGLIYVKQNPFINPKKRIKYVVYLYDKALHKSDTIHTPPFGF